MGSVDSNSSRDQSVRSTTLAIAGVPFAAIHAYIWRKHGVESSVRIRASVRKSVCVFLQTKPRQNSVTKQHDEWVQPISTRPFTPPALCPSRSHVSRVSYFWEQSGKDVANCHKLPTYLFDRRIVSVDEIAQALHRSLSNVLRVNPQALSLIHI